MNNDWIVTIKLLDMPEDADAESIAVLVNALLDSNGDVDYMIAKIERAK